MSHRTTAVRMVLMALLFAALACNTVMGGPGRGAVEEAQATADAALTQAAEEFGDLGDVQATANALSTEAAEAFDDLDDPLAEATAEDEEPSDDGPADEQATEAPIEIPGSGDAPDDIPVFDGSNSNFFATAEIISYSTDGSYADVVAFYRAEMEANGWTYNDSLSIEIAGTATLMYDKDGRTATVSIITDSANGGTLVSVLLS